MGSGDLGHIHDLKPVGFADELPMDIKEKSEELSQGFWFTQLENGAVFTDMGKSSTETMCVCVCVWSFDGFGTCYIQGAH